MATEIKKYIDVVTQSVNVTAASGVTPAIVAAGQATRSGELLTPALASVAPVQTASVVTPDSVTMDGIIECAIGASSDSLSIVLPFACKVVDAWAYKVGVSADAHDVLAIKNGATDILTFALDVADGARVSGLGTGIDHADNSFAAGATLTVEPTNNTTCACILFIRVKRTA